MNPHQRNKIDVSKMSPEEQKIFRLYGKVPNTKDLLQNKLKERKYFDSGDYALSKAGKASDIGVSTIGSQHPQPENIPHLSSPVPATSNGNGVAPGIGNSAHPGPNQAGSPVKESSFLHCETSADDTEGKLSEQDTTTSPGEKKGVPIRWQT